MTHPAFVAMGDLHLDHLIWRKHRNIVDDALVSFRSLVDHAIRLKVPLVLVGDICDSTDPDSDIADFLRTEMDRCQAANVLVYAIQGNHDKRPHKPWYCAVSDWPIHFGDGAGIEINGLKCVGLDYALRDQIQEQLAALVVPSNAVSGQILFLHQAVKQGLRFEGAWNCDLDWVPENFKLVVMGDIHNAARFPLKNGGEAFYTGSTHPRSVSEIGQKFALVVNDDLTTEQVPLTCRAIHRAFLGDLAAWDVQSATEWAKNAIVSPAAGKLAPVAWLAYTAERAQLADEIEAAIKRVSSEIITIREPIVFRKIDVPDASKISTDDLPSIEGMVARLIDPGDNKFAYEMTVALLDPRSNPQETIAAYRDRFLTQKV